MKSGLIYNISRKRIETDGSRMTTLVKLKGCKLKCSYCTNENVMHQKKEEPDLMPAIKYTPDKFISELEKDGRDYAMVGGDIVFSGGEPLLQADFIVEVCERLSEPWSIIIETSLSAYWEEISKLTKYVDLWIVDIKDMNPNIYSKYTCSSNEGVIENLYKLVNAVGCEKVHVRVPRIPDFNTEEDVERSSNYIRDKLCIEPEVFTYTVDRNQKPEFHYPMFFCGGDFTEDRSCQRFLEYILSDKENFFAHTSEYLKKNINEDRISWVEDCYRLLFTEIYVFAKTKGYSCSNEEVQEIIDTFLSSLTEIDEDAMLGYSIKIKIKEQLRNKFEVLSS